MKKFLAFLTILLCFIALFSITAYAEESSHANNIPEIEISGVNIIPVRTSYEFSANAENVTWSSSDKTVATVSTNGTVKGISAGSCRITAQSEDSSAFFDVRIVPNAISDANASLSSTTKAKISWTVLEGVSGYYVYRMIGSGSWSRIAEISNGKTAFYDTAVSLGYKYTFRIYPFTDCDSGRIIGTPSKDLSLNASLPAPTTSVICTSNTSLKISWTGFSGASGYEIYRKSGENDTFGRIKAQTALSLSNTSLTPGKNYYYKVRSYAKIGTKTYYSPFSTIVSRTCGLAVPGSFAVRSNAGANILSWKAVKDASSYRIYRFLPGESKYTCISTVNSSALSYTDRTAPVGIGATYCVCAYAKKDGTAIFSNYTAKLKTYRKPGLSTLTASCGGTRKITLSWTASSGATGYYVYRSTSKNDSFTKIADTTKRAYTDSSLTVGKTYYYKILPYSKINGIITSGYYAEANLMATPAMVSSVSAVSAASSVSLSWKAVSEASGYTIYRRTVGGSWVFQKNVLSSVLSYKDTTPVINTKYEYCVKAYILVKGTAYRGPISALSTGYVTDIASAKVSSVVATGNTRITVKWTKSDNAQGYELYVKSSVDSTWTLVKKFTSNTTFSYIHGARRSGVTYYYRIRPYSVIGNDTFFGQFSSAVGRTMPNKYWGIDVSKYQGKIDWQKVKDAGISYVMIRASYTYNDKSAINTDEMFITNIKGAKAAGLKVGVYAYCTLTTAAGAKREANYILNLVKGYSLDLPIAYDYERKDVSDYTFMAKAFCDTISAAGYSACIYGTPAYMSNNSSDTHLDYSQLSIYPIWVARYPFDNIKDYKLYFNNAAMVQDCVDKGYYNPSFPEANNSTVFMWQYTSKGYVDGINTAVDLNVMYF